MPTFAGLRSISAALVSCKLRVASLLGVLVLALALSGVPDAQATNVLLFSTMGSSAAPTATGITTATASASPSVRYAQPFVAQASGPVGIVSLWAQCTWSGVGNLCSPSGSAEITIAADNGGVPGTSLTATSQFQSPVSTGGSPICAPTLSNPTLTAGVTYWAVLASAGQTSWLFQDDTPGGPKESTDNGASWHAAPTNKRLSLKVESATACGPLAVPNPLEGSTLDRIITAPGAKANSNISIGNQGSADLSITGASFGGANPGVFSLYQLFDVSVAPILWQLYAFPKSVPVSGTESILYVVCTGPATEGNYTATLTVTTNDPAHASMTWNLSCLVDNTPPTIQFNFTPNGNNGWFRTSPASGSILALDPESGGLVKNITCTLNGNPLFNAPASAISPANISAQGDNLLSCTATDVANNVGSGSTHVKLDSVPPVIAGSKTPASNAAGWNNTDVSVAFACTDAAPGSGVASNTIGGGGPFTTETTGTVSTSTGACQDTAGNDAVAASVTVKLDKTLPVISPTVTPAPNASGWNNTNLTISYACLDGGAVQSGIAVDTVPNVPVSTETAGTTVNSTGTCSDNAGNNAVISSVLVKLDKTAPTTSILGAPANTTSNALVPVAFTGDDGAGSGLSSFECALDAGGFIPCTSITNYFLTDGLHQIHVRALDVAGNRDATPASQSWLVDTTPPTVQILVAPPAVTNATTASFEFIGNDGAGGSGVAGFDCRLDGGPWGSCATPRSYSGLGEGNHTFDVRAIDNAGNVGVVFASHAWLVDTTAPTITASAKKADNSPYAAGTWTSQNVTVHFDCADTGGSGVANCTSDVVVTTTRASTPGTAIDDAGNSSSTAFGQINIDKVAPTIAASAKKADNSPYVAGVWTDQDVTVHFECADTGGSGIATCTSDVVVSASTASVGGTAADTAGNTTNAGFGPVNIDRTKPTISAAAVGAPNAVGWYNANVTVRFTCADPESGIPGGACPADEVLSAEGLAVASTAQTVTNGAGAVSDPSNVVTVKIDKTKPTITAAAVSAPNAAGWYNTNVTVRYTCTDGLSGILAGACPGDQVLTAEGAAVASLAQAVTDAAGNVSDASNVITVKIDKTAPDTTLAQTIGATDAEFTFGGTDPGGSGVASFECKLDGAPFAPCVSPQPYSGLAGGPHSFSVRGLDNAGNADASPATFEWLVDQTPPDTAITSQPAAVTNATSAAFEFSGTDNPGGSGVSAFQCSLDGAVFAACVSPKTHSGLAEGSHTFQVRAQDAAGNTDPTPANYTWTVDITKPTISAAATSSPNAAGWYRTNVVIRFTCADALSGIPLSACPADQTLTAEGAAVASLAQTVTDAAGNVSDPSNVVTVKIDKTAPVLTVPANFAVDATGPTGATVNFAATATDANAVSVVCAPASGTLFAIATTTVNCGATDVAGNVTNKSFTVQVRSAASQTTNAIASLNALPGVNGATKRTLTGILQNAADAIAAGQKASACSKLNDYISTVNGHVSAKKLSLAQGAALIADANRIRAVLGC